MQSRVGNGTVSASQHVSLNEHTKTVGGLLCRFNSCEVPQEMTDEEIDAKLDAESLAAQTFDHATLSRRAPLDQVRLYFSWGAVQASITADQPAAVCIWKGHSVWHSMLRHMVLLTCCVGLQRAIVQHDASWMLPRHCCTLLSKDCRWRPSASCAGECEGL